MSFVRWCLFLCILLHGIGTSLAQQQSLLRTHPENTGFEQTSRYADVTTFLDTLDRSSDRLVLFSFGYTTEGREIPAMLVDVRAEAGLETVKSTDRARILVIANIHAGEVCGKEATLMLLRELAEGAYSRWLDSLSIVFVPIYNADGNERIDLFNRPQQYGPLGGMGQRANARGFDLNRDFIKLDAPESRSLVSLIHSFDPHVIIDLHTTDGSYHAYHLTFDPPLNPNTDQRISSFMRSEWVPALQSRLKQQDGYDVYYYGNLPWPGTNDPPGWYTYDHRPRFGINYAGLRNRFGILSEAYAYLPFKERIDVTRSFLVANIDFAHMHARHIKRICAQLDDERIAGRQLALTGRYRASEKPVTILMGEVEEQINPYSGGSMLVRKDVVHPEKMIEYGEFEGARFERVPSDYYLPDSLRHIIDLLQTHGIVAERLTITEEILIEQFVVDSVHTSSQMYEGHFLTELSGYYERKEKRLDKDYWRVTTAQPLGRLVFYMLEPQSDDGIAAWSLIEHKESPNSVYPVCRSVQ